MNWGVIIGVLIVIVFALIRLGQINNWKFSVIRTYFQKPAVVASTPTATTTVTSQKFGWIKWPKLWGKILWPIVIFIGIWVTWSVYKHPERTEWVPLVGEMTNETLQTSEIVFTKNEYLKEKRVCGLESGRKNIHVEDTQLHLKNVAGETVPVGSILGLKSSPGEQFTFVQNERYSWGLIINKGRATEKILIKDGCIQVGFNIPLSQRESLKNYELIEPTAVRITLK